MSLQKNLHWFIYPIFFLACARQTAPTGGPKDTIPPVLTASMPVKEQLNYKGKHVELTFSEMIQLNNPKEQIIVTPDVGGEYDITTRKNKVILTFRKPLNDSTTYLINFRDAVADITEKNPATNLKLAFSTGNYIDSLSIRGTIQDLLKAKETKDATVALYQQDTFDIFKHKPVYLTKTNDKGAFVFENLKPGNYFVYAIEDKNKNLVVDSKTEGFGFLANAIVLKENQKNILIATVHLDMRPLKLTSARPYNTYFNLKAGKNLEAFTFTNQEGEIIISSYGEDKANVKVYNTIEEKDSVAVTFHAYDSISNTIDTTLYIKFNKREVTPEKFQAKTAGFKVIENKGIISGKVNLSKPILSINYDSILYRIDSTKTITFSKQDFQWDSLNNILSVEKKFDKTLLIKEAVEIAPKKAAEQPKPTPVKKDPKDQKTVAAKIVEHQLYFGKGSFLSIELDTSAVTTETVKPAKLEETGIIFVEIQTKEQNFIVELLDKNFTRVQVTSNTKKVTFEDLPPGEYQVRLIIDKDNNGKWSPGNFYKKTEPEPVRFYKNEKNVQIVNLKANWEMGPLLIKF